jgi:hypothetical protein
MPQTVESKYPAAYFVCTPTSRMLASSFDDALWKAFEQTKRSTSLRDRVQSIRCETANRRWDAREIMAEWQARGWRLPS